MIGWDQKVDKKRLSKKEMQHQFHGQFPWVFSCLGPIGISPAVRLETPAGIDACQGAPSPTSFACSVSSFRGTLPVIIRSRFLGGTSRLAPDSFGIILGRELPSAGPRSSIYALPVGDS
ncbi:uncharacterized protein LOC143354877 [Halictus rubicundus]|uniref:uncharacterized protein LOC143354877 n=1 Tax=Halictus rubicundus TaxID=77578 RepID=UPI004036133C